MVLRLPFCAISTVLKRAEQSPENKIGKRGRLSTSQEKRGSVFGAGNTAQIAITKQRVLRVPHILF